jgi:small subunit ribosomal protein S5
MSRVQFPDQSKSSEFSEKIVSLNRVSKVVKGGKRFSFVAFVVVGDGRGSVGAGTGRAREVPEAVRKATEKARKSVFRVPMKEGRTLYHDVEGAFSSGRIILRSAPPGTGVIAGGGARAVLELVGFQDVVSKATRSSNPYNVVGAVMAALSKTETPRYVAYKRGKSVSDILNKKNKVESCEVAE